MRSIQSLIFIRLFAISIIFFGVVSGFVYVLTAEAIKQFAISDASTSLSFIVNNIDVNYKSDLTALDQIADSHVFVPFEEEQAHAFVKEFLELPNIFSTVHLYRADGKLIFAERRSSMGEGPYTPKTNFYDKDPEFIALAKSVMSQRRAKASQTFFSGSGALYQTYVTPVFQDQGKQHVFGILSGGVFPHLQRVDYLLQGLKLGRDNFILITDSKGNFIASDGISEKDVAGSIKVYIDSAVKHFFQESDLSISPQVLLNEHMALGQSRFMAMSLPIPELKLVVTLGVNNSRVETKTRELSYRLFAALVGGLLLSLLASVLVGERLARPFREMAQTIHEINTGNFSARVQYDRNDEIGYLSGRINTLAEKIEKSEYLGNLWSNETEVESEPEMGSKS